MPGKSTLANLIPRFYDATGGRVLIDGKDVRHFTLKSLRESVSAREPGRAALQRERAARTCGTRGQTPAMK